MYELIITEKPNAAQKIAEALADGKPIKESKDGVSYYKVTHGKKDIVVACAVGHLYGLAQKESKGKKWSFPVFDIEWQPSYETSKEAKFSKKYLDTIKKLSKEASSFTVSTDFDIEGEVIGLNIIRYACKQKDANRMKFSTLTKPDLLEAYEHKSKHLDWGQANAGETRHHLDWIHGINYSRALTSAFKTAGSFKIMSTGRVQGPALKIIVNREKEIKSFKPEPFWQIEMQGAVTKGEIIAWHTQDKFFDKKKAQSAFSKVEKEKKAKVLDVQKKQFQQSPPNPFDLTTLQMESYRCHRISPKETLQLGQELYTAGLISYPRTSSQQLSDKIGFKKILTDLSKQKEYQPLASALLSKKKLEPNNGKKTDPAHPAIYPTGIAPKELTEREEKVYDLIVKRFFATFSDPATRETMTVSIDCNSEPFEAKGTRTTEKGWHVFYEPYVTLEEEELPAVLQNESITIKKMTLHEKETQPPKRYTPASIIKELEKRNLGTKSTRAAIVDTLFDRGYVNGKTIEATNLGIKTIETLEKYTPEIVDEELTRHFEEEMDEIREGKKTSEQILKAAQDTITSVITNFKKKEKEIGSELLEANIETRNELTTLGPCPGCKEGNLQLRKGKFGVFAACNRYPECKTTVSLPSNALFKPAKKECEICHYPMVLAIKRARKPMELCINTKCPSKQQAEENLPETPCPQCKEGKMILRHSIYGSFYGCSKYPKCKHTEKIASSHPHQDEKKDETKEE